MDRPSWSRLTRPYLHRSGSPGDSGTGTRRTLGLLCEVDSGVRRQGMPPTLVPRPHPGKGGLRGHPRQALPSHPRTPRAGKSQFQGPLSPRAHGPDLRTGPRSAFRPAPAAQCVCAGAGGGGVVRSSSSPTTAWGGGGAARRWGQGAGREDAAGTGARAALAPAIRPPHSPHFGRHRGHGLAPQRPPSGGDGAHGRGGGASPGLRARPAPAASVGGAAPRRGWGWGWGSDSEPAWPLRALSASRSTGRRGQARGWRSAHRDVKVGAGLCRAAHSNAPASERGRAHSGVSAGGPRGDPAEAPPTRPGGAWSRVGGAGPTGSPPWDCSLRSPGHALQGSQTPEWPG